VKLVGRITGWSVRPAVWLTYIAWGALVRSRMIEIMSSSMKKERALPLIKSMTSSVGPPGRWVSWVGTVCGLGFCQFSVPSGLNNHSMQAPDRRLVESLLQTRSRSDRLLKRVARRLHTQIRSPTDDDIIDACTHATLRSCIYASFCWCVFVVDEFPGGWLFYHWLISFGPLFVVAIIKEQLQV
jgi:hypothetical protein